MYQPPKRHPLSSFRFWFLVLGCVAATTAWRMGWLPKGKTERAQANANVGKEGEVDLATPPQRKLSHRATAAAESPAAPGVTARPAPAATPPANVAAVAPPAQAPEPPAVASETHTADAAPAQPASAAAPQTPHNPFGPAHPEFVAATPAAAATAQPNTNEARRYPADPGMIQQVAAVEAEPQVKAASIVTGDAMPDFPQAAAPQVNWDEIDRLISTGQDVEAHRLLSTLYWEQADLRPKLRTRIEQTAQRIYFQPQPHYVDPYPVQPGDLLQQIARQYLVSWQYLAKLNRTDPQRIRPGQNLKVIQGPFGAIVDLRRFELTVHAHGYFVARFPIGIGKDGSTPVGEFTVQDKLEDPTYYGPDGVIAHDDPRNPLGEFWLSLGDGYGIHGTIDDSSIGRAESRGCLRLKNQDIADLFDLLTVGSPVVIRR